MTGRSGGGGGVGGESGCGGAVAGAGMTPRQKRQADQYRKEEESRGQAWVAHTTEAVGKSTVNCMSILKQLSKALSFAYPLHP